MKFIPNTCGTEIYMDFIGHVACCSPMVASGALDRTGARAVRHSGPRARSHWRGKAIADTFDHANTLDPGSGGATYRAAVIISMHDGIASQGRLAATNLYSISYYSYRSAIGLDLPKVRYLVRDRPS